MPVTYELVCGMEVHAELKTASKMFCGCKNDPFHAPAPNTYTCPVCLGMPGGLPVANKKAIEWTIKLGLALGCKINLFSHFDRKNYFYPDLPKGYQISQYDQPFCYDGQLDTELGAVRIRRIHLEEDTAKLQHKTVNGKNVSLIDFNRGGVPLVEIVTEPDITSPEHAKAYGKTLRQILRFLDIADCDMEQGGMRLEANVSIRPVGEKGLPNFKTELKNINSFRFMEKAVAYEMERQACELGEGRTPIQETRGWNDAKGETFSQRIKEDAEDYRYFPDPDLPPVHFTQADIDRISSELPELPAQMKARWNSTFGIDPKYADVLTEERETAHWVESLFTAAQSGKLDPNKLANAIVNKKILVSVGDDVQSVLSTFKALHQTDSVDEVELNTAISSVLAEQAETVAQYKTGKTQVFGFFMGQVQKKLGKKVDPQTVKSALEKQLNA